MKQNNNFLFIGIACCIVTASSGETHEFTNESHDAIEVTLSFRNKKCQNAFAQKTPREIIMPGQKSIFALGTCPLEKITLRRAGKNAALKPRSAEFYATPKKTTQ